MALNRHSSYEEIEAQYVENIGYELTGSVASAKLFFVACELLIHRTADVTAHKGLRIQKPTAAYAMQRNACIRWMRAHGVVGTPVAEEPSAVSFQLRAAIVTVSAPEVGLFTQDTDPPDMPIAVPLEVASVTVAAPEVGFEPEIAVPLEVASVTVSAPEVTVTLGRPPAVEVPLEVASVTVSAPELGVEPEISMALDVATVTVSAPEVCISPQCGAGLAPTIDQNTVTHGGITWTLDGTYPVATALTGDQVVISATGFQITAITPTPSSGRNGSWKNLIPQGNSQQPWDDRGPGYNAALGESLPITMSPGDSLVTARGWDDAIDGAPYVDGLGYYRPCLGGAAVITCLGTPPPADFFRPWYAGGTTPKPLYTLADIAPQVAALPALNDPGTSRPTYANALSDTDGLLLLSVPTWSDRYFHPKEHMPDYGNYISGRMSRALCQLICDIPEDKTQLAVNMTQIGLDWYGLLESGGMFWSANGGHQHGRIAVIMTAGWLLDVADMRSVGFRYKDATDPNVVPGGLQIFAEIGYTYYGVSEALFGKDCQGVVGNKHQCRDPNGLVNDPVINGKEAGGYRRCCTFNTLCGAALALKVLGLSGNNEFAWPAFFDYMDSHMVEMANETSSFGPFWRSMDQFPEDMYDAHNASYPNPPGGP